MITLQQPLDFQHRGHLDIDWNNPLTAGLIFAAVPAGHAWHDLITNLRSTLRAGSTHTLWTPAGERRSTTLHLRGSSAGTNVFPAATRLDAHSGPVTLFMEGCPEGDGLYRIGFQSWSAVAGEGVGIGFDDGPGAAVNSTYGLINNSFANTGVANALGADSHLYSHRIALSWDGTSRRAYAGGKIVLTTADTRLPTTSTSRRVFMGGNSGAGSGFDTSASLLLAWNRPISSAEYASLYENPWQVFTTKRVVLPFAVAGATYTLTADNGSYTTTGQDASLLRSKVISGNQGSYSITGQTASIFKTKVIDASFGSYSLTGQNATITYAPGGSYTLTADQGTYTLTGQTAGLTKSKVISAAQGTYSLAGQAATLSYSGTNTITLKAGSWLRYRIIT